MTLLVVVGLLVGTVLLVSMLPEPGLRLTPRQRYEVRKADVMRELLVLDLHDEQRKVLEDAATRQWIAEASLRRMMEN